MSPAGCWVGRFLGTTRGTRIGTLSTTLIPTLMGTQAIAYLGSPADAPFALVSTLAGPGHAQKPRVARPRFAT